MNAIEPYAELRATRLAMGYSMGELAQQMKIHKATLQGYEEGRRKIPDGFIERVKEQQQLDREFMAGIPQRVDEHLMLEGYASGIPSEDVEVWDEC